MKRVNFVVQRIIFYYYYYDQKKPLARMSSLAPGFSVVQHGRLDSNW